MPSIARPGSLKALGYLLTAESELERVSHIARQTLGYYRDTGSPSEVHLHDLVENVLKVYGSKLLASGISVETSFNDLRKIVVSNGEVIIRDQGVGISPEHLEKIFEPFFTTKGNLGTGIGLWVAKLLTERRGGPIAVNSRTEPGKSVTSVSIYVPFARPAAAITGE